MKIETGHEGKLRINFYNGCFIDITDQADESHRYALSISNFDLFGFYALCDFGVAVGRFRFLVFPDKTWFDEWFGALSNPPQIIVCGGCAKVGTVKAAGPQIGATLGGPHAHD